MNCACLIQCNNLQDKDRRIQRCIIKFVTLTTPIAATAAPCGISMATHRWHKATNPTIPVTLTRSILSLLLYLCMFHSLELTKSNHAPRTDSYPVTELCLGEREIESLLHSGPVFTHNLASKMTVTVVVHIQKAKFSSRVSGCFGNFTQFQ